MHSLSKTARKVVDATDGKRIVTSRSFVASLYIIITLRAGFTMYGQQHDGLVLTDKYSQSNLCFIHTYHSRFIPIGVAVASQLFL
jgi:hypothetical protein